MQTKTDVERFGLFVPIKEQKIVLADGHVPYPGSVPTKEHVEIAKAAILEMRKSRDNGK